MYNYLQPMIVGLSCPCRMVTGRAGDSLGGMGLTITRVIVHPAVWGLMSMWFRFVLRHIGARMGGYARFP